MILSDFSLRRPVAIATVLIALMIIGLFCYTKLGLDFLPQIDMPYVTVNTIYPGAAPQEVETLISQPIEDAVSEVDGVKHVQSTSMENVSQVFIEFEMGTNVDFAAMDVREKIDLIKGDMPDDAEDPAILKFDVNASPIANVALTGDRTVGELYDLADQVVRDQLTRIPGLASVDIVGGDRREIQVRAHQERLAAHNMSILQLTRAISAENIEIPSGHITQAGEEYAIRFEGEFELVEQLRALDIHLPGGGIVPLRSMADVVDTFAEKRELARSQGLECVGMVLKKRGDANTVAVVDRLQHDLGEIQRTLPAGVNIELINENSAFIRSSVSEVLSNMILGIILTGLLLFIFLHDWRQTVIGAIAMPMSVVATFILIYFAGFTLNMMTLMALAISIGILVTNSIVVMENIYRHLDRGDGPRAAAATGASEIAVAVLGSTLTNLVVFLPIAFMSGLIGQFFREFGLTVTFATLVSLFISFTLTPLLCARLMCVSHGGSFFARIGQAWDRGYDRIAAWYGRLVAAALRGRTIVLSIGLAMFIASLGLAAHLGSEMITEPDRAEFAVTMELPPGTPLAVTAAALTRLETALRTSFPEDVTNIYVKLGKVEGVIGKSSQGVNMGELLVLLKPKDQRAPVRDIMTRAREIVAAVPAGQVTVRQTTAIGGSEAPLQIEITGPEMDTLRDLERQVYAIARATPGAADVDTTWRPGRPELKLIPDRRRLQDAGLSVAYLAGLLRNNLEGATDTEYRVGDQEYDIRVKLTEEARQSIDQVRAYLVPLPSGGSVPLADLCTIVDGRGYNQITRKDKRRMLVVTANIAAGRSLGEVVADMRREIDKVAFPPGYGVFYGGMVERMGESFRDLLVAFVLAVVLTYLVLAALLESWLQPLTIMLTLPLALVGVFAALYVTHTNITIFSLMAVVMLVGIVVNNAILIIDYIGVLRAAGKSRTEAVLEACPVKLRPIVMTTAATIAGMVPVAISTGMGAEMRAPMAIVQIGGLAVSAVLALLVIPVTYTLFDDLGGHGDKPGHV